MTCSNRIDHASLNYTFLLDYGRIDNFLSEEKIIKVITYTAVEITGHINQESW